MVKTITTLIFLPVVSGLLIATYLPLFTKKIKKTIEVISMVIFIAFIVVAFLSNLDIFTNYIHYVLLLVFIQNLAALSSGYYIGKIAGLNEKDSRTVAIETGIQNGGLGLALVFNFFGGIGGMALIVGWWGIWDMLSGLLLSVYWSKKSSENPIVEVIQQKGIG